MVPALCAATVLFLSFMLGALTIPSGWVDSVRSAGRVDTQEHPWPLFIRIISGNLLSALFMFSGVLTFGLTTFISMFFTGVFFGLSISTAVSAAGMGNLIAESGSYLPLEILGFIAAGTAGLIPLHELYLTNRRKHRRPRVAQRFIKDVQRGLQLSLVPLSASVVLLVSGAIVETLVIVIRR